MTDTERITQAIMATGAPPLALEEGAGLAEHWIAEGVCAEKRIVAVECGFVYWLDARTAVVGVQDLLTDEGTVGVVGNEWKTAKEKTRYWNEDRWFESVSEGSQCAIYALALREGRYYEAGREPFEPRVERPAVRVRAVSKSTPPVVWPTGHDGVLTFTDEQLGATRRALLAKAASIRAMRATGSVPWQLPGIWCVNQFRRQCEYYEECRTGRYPEGYGEFDRNDPAFRLAFPHLDTLGDPDTVVLGASMYSAVSECAEKYRRATLDGNGEESMALGTGTVFHAAVASWYRQVRKRQQQGAVLRPDER